MKHAFIDLMVLSSKQDIKEGTHVELPFWLAKILYQRNMVRMDLPRSFSNKLSQDIAADPNAVCLRDKSPTFYEAILAVTPAVSTEDARRMLGKAKYALTKRAPRIMDTAHNSLNQDVSDFTTNLTDLEQQVFEAGYKFEKEKLAWRKREIERFAWTDPSTYNLSGRKRGR